jgi:hypothetical protein
MTRWFVAIVSLLPLLGGARAQVHAVADLPLPPDLHPALPADPPAGPPYSREGARYYCKLALEHPPFPRIPFADTEPVWLAKCSNRFFDPEKSAGKRAETLVCEMRGVDILAEASRYGVGSNALPTLSSFLAKCEREFRANALHLPALAPPPEHFQGRGAGLPYPMILALDQRTERTQQP